MDSRSPPAEAALRRRLWLPAIVLWTAFLGATLGLFVTVLLLPAAASQALDWHALSLLFLCGWLAQLVPIGFALLLARPLFAHGAGDGR